MCIAEDADVVGEVIAEDSFVRSSAWVKRRLPSLGVYAIDGAAHGGFVRCLIVDIPLGIDPVEVGIVVASRRDLTLEDTLVRIKVDMAVAILLAEVSEARRDELTLRKVATIYIGLVPLLEDDLRQ